MSLPRLQAPPDDGQVLAYPPLAEVGALLEANRNRLRAKRLPLLASREQTIAEITAATRAYLAECEAPTPDFSGESLILAGHQPDLFHPGVWLKNFAIHTLARRHGATPINLVVDNDVVKSPALRVSSLAADPSEVRLSSVHYDDAAGETVYEERPVHNEAMFQSFPQRLGEMTADWPFEPLAVRHWPEFTANPQRTLGERLVAGRRALERQWGCHNLELPLSRLCATESFAAFAASIIADLPAFQEAYNAAVRDYRRRHGIRNAFHPFPDLGRDGDWLEAPFWAWRHGQPRRSRLFVRQAAGRLHMRVGGETWPDLPLADPVPAWRKLEADGFKVRTRALTTTLFARVYLADLFVHGIGGGKYDEVTDALIARYWGVEPPAYLVVTGTLRLPLPRFRGGAADLRASQRLVRDLDWNPQRHLEYDAPGAIRLQTLIASDPAAQPAKRERFQAIRECKDELRAMISERRINARRHTERLGHEVAANAILGRRDYSFALYPAEPLRQFLAQVTVPASN